MHREFGKAIGFEQLFSFDLGESCALAPQELAGLLRIVHHPEELMRLEPVEGAAEALREWAAAGYEIAVVTGRPPFTYEASVAWLARHHIPYRDFTVVDKYGRFDAYGTIGLSLVEL